MLNQGKRHQRLHWQRRVPHPFPLPIHAVQCGLIPDQKTHQKTTLPAWYRLARLSFALRLDQLVREGPALGILSSCCGGPTSRIYASVSSASCSSSCSLPLRLRRVYISFIRSQHSAAVPRSLGLRTNLTTIHPCPISHTPLSNNNSHPNPSSLVAIVPTTYVRLVRPEPQTRTTQCLVVTVVVPSFPLPRPEAAPSDAPVLCVPPNHSMSLPRRLLLLWLVLSCLAQALPHTHSHSHLSPTHTPNPLARIHAPLPRLSSSSSSSSSTWSVVCVSSPASHPV